MVQARATAAWRIAPRLLASAAAMDGGYFLLMTAMPFKVLDLGGGGFALGLVAAVGAITYIIAAPLCGRWSEHRDRRRLAAAGSLTLAICALVAWQVERLELLIAAQMLMGLGKALYWPPVQAAVGDLVPDNAHGPALGRFNLAWSSGKMVGFVAGGLLLACCGFRAAYLAGALSVTAALWLLPRRIVGETAPMGASTDDRGDETPPTVDRSASDQLVGAWIANSVAYGALGILTFHLPQFFAHRGWNAAHYGWFFGAVLASQTAVFALGGRWLHRPWSWSRLLWPQVLATVAVAGLARWSQYGLVLAAAPVIGLSCGVCYQASIAASLRQAGLRGRRAGIHEGLVGAGGFLPPLLAGLLVRETGRLVAPYVLAAGLLATALVVQLWLATRQRTARYGSP